MNEILNIIHKTIYQFIDASEDDVLMSEKYKLLLKVNKAICNNLKAFNVHDTNAGDLISRQEVSDIIKTRLYQTALNNTEYITSYDKVCEDIAENRIDTWINEAKSVESEQNLQPTCNQLATDCISRQELLNAISQKEYGHDYDGNKDILGLKYVDIIKEMPSVKLEKCGDCVSRQAVLDLAKCGRLVSNGNYKSVCDAINGLPSVELEKCGDCISREAATDRFDLVQSDDLCMSYDDIMAFLSSLPSVEPEGKTGKWVEGKKTPGYIKWHCSECGLLVRNSQKPWYKFCPMCGSRMEVDV